MYNHMVVFLDLIRYKPLRSCRNSLAACVGFVNYRSPLLLFYSVLFLMYILRLVTSISIFNKISATPLWHNFQ